MTTVPARVEVQASALMALLGDSKPFASTDTTLPQINGITFEFAGTDLLAMATDRYMLAVSRLPIGETIVQPVRVVALSEVTEIEKAFKPARGHDQTLALEFGEEALSIETTATLDGHPTIRMAFPWAIGTPLNWRKISEVAPVEGAPATASFNPQYLARFAKIQRDNEPVTIWPTSAAKPWRCTIGDHFTCFVMPVRIAAASWTPSAVNVAAEAAPKAARKPRARKAA